MPVRLLLSVLRIDQGSKRVFGICDSAIFLTRFQFPMKDGCSPPCDGQASLHEKSTHAIERCEFRFWFSLHPWNGCWLNCSMFSIRMSTPSLSLSLSLARCEFDGKILWLIFVSISTRTHCQAHTCNGGQGSKHAHPNSHAHGRTTEHTNLFVSAREGKRKKNREERKKKKSI